MQLRGNEQLRDQALFNLAIGSTRRACDLLKMSRISRVAAGSTRDDFAAKDPASSSVRDYRANPTIDRRLDRGTFFMFLLLW